MAAYRSEVGLLHVDLGGTRWEVPPYHPDGSFQHRDDSSFGSQPAFVVVARHGTVLNVHLLDRPRKGYF